MHSQMRKLVSLSCFTDFCTSASFVLSILRVDVTEKYQPISELPVASDFKNAPYPM